MRNSERLKFFLLIWLALLATQLTFAYEPTQYAIDRLTELANGDPVFLNKEFAKYFNGRASVVKLDGDDPYEFQFAQVLIPPAENLESISITAYMVRIKSKGASDVLLLAPHEATAEDGDINFWGEDERWTLGVKIDRTLYLAADIVSAVYTPPKKMWQRQKAPISFEDISFSDKMFLLQSI